MSEQQVRAIGGAKWAATVDGRTFEGFPTRALAQKWIDDAVELNAASDALDLVRRIAERPETLLLLRSWTLDRCALCDALVPWDGHTEHKPSCPWLEARRIVALLNDSDGPGAGES